MTQQITLYLIDEVNCYFEGLTSEQIDTIIKKTERSVKGAYQTAAYKLNKWNGKESQFRKDGFTFQYLLEKVFKIMEEQLLIDLDQQVEIIDHRKPLPVTIDQVSYCTENFLSNTGKTLHAHQIESINAVIDNMKGVIRAATASGKSLIALGICKSFDHCFPSITIVPNMSLVEQMKADFEEEGTLNFSVIKKEHTQQQREEIAANCRHIIITWKLFNNCYELFEDFQGIFIYDESHACGDVMYYHFKNTLSECPVRIGMTATLPKDKQKTEKILCHIGGDPLIEVETKELQDKGLVSSCNITVVPVNDPHVDDDFGNWDIEVEYLRKNKRRINSIANYINTLSSTNTMILTNRQTGNELAQHLGTPFIDKDTEDDERQRLYQLFENQNDCLLTATYGTVGTGISINRIFRLILIDVGKDPITIFQSIGRGLRKDGNIDHLEVIDIYSELKYSKRHKKERIKLYKQKEYPFTESINPIMVQ